MTLKKPKTGLKAGAAVKVELFPSCKENIKNSDPYATTQFRFSPCSKIEKGATKQLTDLIGCREGLIGRVKRHYNGEVPLPGYSTEKTTLLAYANPGKLTKDYSGWLANTVATSVALANHFEDLCGWLKTKSFIGDLDVKTAGIIYVFQGSRWWSTAPQTLSLYLLLLRLGRRNDMKALGKTFSTNDLIKALKKGEKNNDELDSYYLKRVEQWPLFLKNRAKVFSKRKFSTNFAESSSTDGIYRLTDGDIEDDLIKSRFEKLLK